MTPDRNEFIEGFNMGRTAGAEGRESRLKSGRKWYNAGYNNGYDVGQCKCWDINAEGAFLEVVTDLLSQCAAGPWQPMSTVPEDTNVLLQLNNEIVVGSFLDDVWYLAGGRYDHGYRTIMIAPERIRAWAAINTQEGEE